MTHFPPAIMIIVIIIFNWFNIIEGSGIDISKQ